MGKYVVAPGALTGNVFNSSLLALLMLIPGFAAADSLGPDIVYYDHFSEDFDFQFSDNPVCQEDGPWEICNYDPLGRFGRIAWDWPNGNCLFKVEHADTTNGELVLEIPGNGIRQGGQVETIFGEYWYGRYRIRMKTGTHSEYPGRPGPQGSVSAFYASREGATSDNEIDIEILSRENYSAHINAVIHYDGDVYPGHCTGPVDPSTGYVTYGFDWYADHVEFFAGDSTIPCEVMNLSPDQRVGMILAHWTGNNWAGQPPPQSATMKVDWLWHSPFLQITLPFHVHVPWSTGLERRIEWDVYGDVAGHNVRLDLYDDDQFLMNIANNIPADSGGYTWPIPYSIAPGTDYRVKVTSLENSDYYDYSNYLFEIIEGHKLELITPNGGETWHRGGYNPIRWSDSVSSPRGVNIDLYKDDVEIMRIATWTTDDGELDWWVPDDIPLGSANRIKLTVRNRYGEEFYAYSSAPFIIAESLGDDDDDDLSDDDDVDDDDDDDQGDDDDDTKDDDDSDDDDATAGDDDGPTGDDDDFSGQSDTDSDGGSDSSSGSCGA